MSQSKSKQENTISSKMVFSYSSKKKILTRDWKEEEENVGMAHGGDENPAHPSSIYRRGLKTS